MFYQLISFNLQDNLPEVGSMIIPENFYPGTLDKRPNLLSGGDGTGIHSLGLESALTYSGETGSLCSL